MVHGQRAGRQQLILEAEGITAVFHTRLPAARIAWSDMRGIGAFGLAGFASKATENRVEPGYQQAPPIGIGAVSSSFGEFSVGIREVMNIGVSRRTIRRLSAPRGCHRGFDLECARSNLITYANAPPC